MMDPTGPQSPSWSSVMRCSPSCRCCHPGHEWLAAPCFNMYFFQEKSWVVCVFHMLSYAYPREITMYCWYEVASCITPLPVTLPKMLLLNEICFSCSPLDKISLNRLIDKTLVRFKSWSNHHVWSLNLHLFCLNPANSMKIAGACPVNPPFVWAKSRRNMEVSWKRGTLVIILIFVGFSQR